MIVPGLVRVFLRHQPQHYIQRLPCHGTTLVVYVHPYHELHQLHPHAKLKGNVLLGFRPNARVMFILK